MSDFEVLSIGGVNGIRRNRLLSDAVSLNSINVLSARIHGQRGGRLQTFQPSLTSALRFEIHALALMA